jgi:hypothetical protein
MNKAEKELLFKLADIWNDFILLPEEHPADREEFALAIHSMQRIIAARGAFRRLNNEHAKKAQATESK